ncbi:hypothetical protein THASP1DRAFT_30003 [Thamnocephalis sphaerospora]|uniref:Biogenesis of lysosome-related organelles complex 1 subunit 7 n=1 Tax=Thamnocephalis sphaerospora TaxID=78915 RepID=A0A4P9XRP1_9FUNG|nr:hypothetical protein THASP1DRAFT_30003 [Thamnocephalis sphaerospora]|eukprot:RKP08181.1 hypothetical protein THASP1DRAFT_30003 [Thamnocephalis sphaerospora]
MYREPSNPRTRSPPVVERILSTHPASPTTSLSTPESPSLRRDTAGVTSHMRASSEGRPAVVPPGPVWTEQAPESGAVAHAVVKDALLSGLVKVMLEFEERAAALRQSQDELQQEVKRIRTELRRYADAAKPPDLKDPLEQLEHARKKLTSVNSMLLRVQERLDRMCTLLSSRNTERRTEAQAAGDQATGAV